MPKLLDFWNTLGSDRRWRRRITLQPHGIEEVTANYRPPELFLGDVAFAHVVDAWSAGCVLFELVTRRRLFPRVSDSCVFQDILAGFELAELKGLPSWDFWQGKLGKLPSQDKSAPLDLPQLVEYLGPAGIPFSY